MGELADDFRFMKEKQLERRQKLEPSRVEHATNKLMKIGCEVAYNGYDKCLSFNYNGLRGRFYPYKGWYFVRGVGSGRGLKKLLGVLTK